jgi:hypothetical protein
MSNPPPVFELKTTHQDDAYLVCISDRSDEPRAPTPCHFPCHPRPIRHPAASIAHEKTGPERGFLRMPEEGLEPPTRGL